MAFISWFKNMMGFDIVHRPMTGRDEYSKPILGPPVTYKGRVEYKTRRVVATSGSMIAVDVVSAGAVYFYGTPAISVDDEITLPDGKKPKIITWDRATDESSVVCTIVYFG